MTPPGPARRALPPPQIRHALAPDFIPQSFPLALLPARACPGRARGRSRFQTVPSVPGALPGSVCRNGGRRRGGALCLLAGAFDVQPGGGGRASVARAAERGGPERRRSGLTWVSSGREAAARGDQSITTLPGGRGGGGEGGRVGAEPSRGEGRSLARWRREAEAEGRTWAMPTCLQARPCPRAASRAAAAGAPGGRVGAALRWRIVPAAAGGCVRSHLQGSVLLTPGKIKL